MKYIKVFFFLLLSLYAVNVFAVKDDPNCPVEMLCEVSTQAINELKQAKKGLPDGERVPRKEIYSIVKEVLLPHIDLNRMSHEVVGRSWTKTPEKQKKRFEVQFTALVINTYASALTTLDKNRIKFFPVRGGCKGKTIVQVKSEVYAPGAPPLPVVYHLERQKKDKKHDEWLVYDLSVDGIGLVQSYKVQFAAIIRQSKLDGLIKTLKKHNAALAATK